MLLGEGRIVVEAVALRAALPGLRRLAPTGSGETVMVVPGFATDDRWTATLRGFLSAIGYHATGWGLHRNHGRVPELIPRLVERTEHIARESDTAVRLIGWSLGGYLAREVARERAELVDRVVTLGAPVVGGPMYTASAGFYRRKGYDLDEIAAGVAERDRRPIEVPVRAIYSRSDGVVAWRACIDQLSPDVEHHEVVASHLGLIRSASVYRLVAELLAERPVTGRDPPSG
jgi:pimeloyl-ACP methyl ester carboxylesterase